MRMAMATGTVILTARVLTGKAKNILALTKSILTFLTKVATLIDQRHNPICLEIELLLGFRTDLREQHRGQ